MCAVRASWRASCGGSGGGGIVWRGCGRGSCCNGCIEEEACELEEIGHRTGFDKWMSGIESREADVKEFVQAV
ncbi:hypothetical protein FGB62_360g00 [Gracilaria domingensis]|nr:hypothetical protein FGB62_360g00 [Gracilaria domingensis]